MDNARYIDVTIGLATAQQGTAVQVQQPIKVSVWARTEADAARIAADALARLLDDQIEGRIITR